jgi:hypothetical protein
MDKKALQDTNKAFKQAKKEQKLDGPEGEREVGEWKERK